MPLKIIRNDITRMRVDAIVNAAKPSLLGGGGVDGCIHREAGPTLLRECESLGGCEVGSAKITGAGKLSCKYVIHTVGPQWLGGGYGERENLISCYRTSLALAKEHGCESIAFPVISSGNYGYPKDQAMRIAVDTISEFLQDNEMEVYLVVFGAGAYTIGQKLFSDIKSYIDDRYVETHTYPRSERLRREFETECAPCARIETSCLEEKSAAPQEKKHPKKTILSGLFSSKSRALEEAVMQLDESFSEMLLRKIDERGMTDAQCYKKANIDRKLFSKIRSDKMYKPSKPTVLAFAIALELSLEETKDMLMKAGFALSHSNKFDIIIEYFIENKIYDVLQINEALFAFDQSLLGA